MINLAELLGMRSDAARVPCKVLYVHENQLVYPVRTDKGERDHVFGHALIVSCLAADFVVWNSGFNRDSFLNALPAFLKAVPLESAGRPQAAPIIDAIRAKSSVLYPPLVIPQAPPHSVTVREGDLRIAYPHRWEHDKDPEAFVRAVGQLLARRVEFSVFVFGGEDFAGTDALAALSAAIGSSRVAHVGRVGDRMQYLAMLSTCHVCVSTAQHEFFGIAMVEASLLGLAVLVPRRLVYPELFHSACLYDNEVELVERLVELANTRRDQQREVKGLLPSVREQIDLDNVSVRENVLHKLRIVR